MKLLTFGCVSLSFASAALAAQIQTNSGLSQTNQPVANPNPAMQTLPAPCLPRPAVDWCSP